jgi:hypothetical protein
MYVYMYEDMYHRMYEGTWYLMYHKKTSYMLGGSQYTH